MRSAALDFDVQPALLIKTPFQKAMVSIPQECYTEIDGEYFVQLRKSSRHTSRLLGLKTKRRDMAQSDVIEQLIKLRNNARWEAVLRIVDEAQPKAVIDLGIDSNGTCGSRLSHRGRHELKAAEAELPATLVITAPAIGSAPALSLVVACGNPRSALAVQLSRAPIVYLRTAIAHQLRAGGVQRCRSKYVAKHPYGPRRRDATAAPTSNSMGIDDDSDLQEVEDE